jgi:adenosylcobyric acid synthase
MLDTLADALEEHVDVDALLALTRVGGRRAEQPEREEVS